MSAGGTVLDPAAGRTVRPLAARAGRRPGSWWVAVPVPVCLGGLDQGLYFGRRQVLSGAEFGVRASGWDNCSIYLGWRHELEMSFMNGSKIRMTMASQTVAL
jgi:hypothetical protein